MNLKEGVDHHQMTADLMKEESVAAANVSSDAKNRFSNMIESLDMIVVVIIVSAGFLAFIVLYNLTNINITERIREIATIKVLGFNAGESAAYVFKENMLLTAMGSFVGLFFGQWLLEFVMSQIKVDMVWMQARLLPGSYWWAIGLTFLSAVIVDFVLYFKLDRINMAEALKSVE